MSDSDPREQTRASSTLLGSLLRAWLAVPPGRRRNVLEGIGAGSVPSPVYYVLLGLSALIAAFGLLANSPAVVIGAMLVSPLMMPIFGISVGLARGDLRLLRQALVAEFGGVALVILLAVGLGSLPFSLGPTAEIHARTAPTLLDLFVAALAGLAGCLAMIDERISPALPGVAIATSLTPPLAASGLCLAFGAYQGAWGAFLLFFANFLAILAVSAAVFVAAGFVTRAEFGTAAGLLSRFAVAVVGLVLVTVLLTYSLAELIREGRTTQTIKAVLAEELADEPTTTLEQVAFQRQENRIDVLSTARAPRVLPPETVKRIERALASRLGEDVKLYLRFSITKDVAATGATTTLMERNLDGNFTRPAASPRARILQVAEQVTRELVADLPNVSLDSIDLVELPGGPVVVVSIQSPRAPLPEGIQQAEARIQERVGDPALRLLVRIIQSSDVTRKGQILLGQSHFGTSSPEEAAMQARVEREVRDLIQAGRPLIVSAIDAARSANGWTVRALTVGPRVPAPEDVRAIETTLHRRLGQPVALSILARVEVVVSADRYASIEGARRTEHAGRPPVPGAATR